MCITLDDLKELLERRCMQTFTDDEFSSMTSFFHDSGLILLPGTFLYNLYTVIQSAHLCVHGCGACVKHLITLVLLLLNN